MAEKAPSTSSPASATTNGPELNAHLNRSQPARIQYAYTRDGLHPIIPSSISITTKYLWLRVLCSH